MSSSPLLTRFIGKGLGSVKDFIVYKCKNASFLRHLEPLKWKSEPCLSTEEIKLSDRTFGENEVFKNIVCQVGLLKLPYRNQSIGLYADKFDT